MTRSRLRESARFLAAALMFSPAVVLAQKPVGLPDNYPNKPVRIIIGSAAGGNIDACGRTVATLLSQRWGSAVIAENVPGNAGIVGLAAVMRAAPDGYTLMAAGSNTFVAAELVDKVPYNVRTKFPPIASCTFNPFIVAVNNDLPVRNVKEFIAYAKANPNKLNYGYTGGGAPSQLIPELLRIVDGIDMQGIPFKGSGPSYLEQMAGRINLTIAAADRGGHENVGRVDAAFTVRVHNQHGITIKYVGSRRDANYPDLGDRSQSRGTIGIFYTLLGRERFGAVDWL